MHRELSTLGKRAMDEAGEGITIADLREPDAPLVYVNAYFLTMTGYSEDEVIGKNCRFLQTEETDSAQLEIIRKSLSLKVRCEVELLNQRKDGALFWNRLTLSPVKDETGAITHIVGVQSDITAVKKMQDELQKYNKELETLKTRVDKNLHEFINELHGHLSKASYGSKELVQKDLTRDPQVKKLISLVEESSKRSHELSLNLATILNQCGGVNVLRGVDPVKLNMQ